MEGLQFRKTCNTQIDKNTVEWKAIIITLIEMKGRKRLRLIRLIRKNQESIKNISGSSWQDSYESQGLGLISVILIKKNGVNTFNITSSNIV